MFPGGGYRDRTCYLLNANQALSQMSKSPIELLVGRERLELSTPPLSRVCSNQLSYRPYKKETLL
jgi:hypothetical protein